MITQEQENYYRHITYIVCEARNSFLNLLDFYLKEKRLTFHAWIKKRRHEIYHNCFNNLCCLCSSHTQRKTVLYPQQLQILFDETVRDEPGHDDSDKSYSGPHSCFPVKPNLSLEDLDFTLARFLLIDLSSMKKYSVERNAVETLTNIRNETFHSHAKETSMENDKYQKYRLEIEKSILVLARIYGKEEETKKKLTDIAKQPYNHIMCQQYHCLLLERYDIGEKLDKLLEQKKLPDCLTRDIHDNTVTEGCDARFEIWTKQNNLRSIWLKDDVEIVRSERFIASTSGTHHILDIKNTVLSDKGQYTVKVKDIKRQACLDVKEYFVLNLKKEKCIEGETAEFTCEVIQDSLPACWKKNGIRLENDEKYEISQAGKSYRLAIKTCDLNDSAEYTVSINNRVRTTCLAVTEYFTKPLVTMTCIEGENVQFECEVLDYSKTATWSKDDTEVRTSDRYKLESQGKRHILVINNAIPEDKGGYSVKIKNCVRKTELVVQEFFTKPLTTKTCFKGETVQLECEVLDDNQTAIWFKDGTELSISNKYAVEHNGKFHRLVVNKTEPGDKGEYTVKIKNCFRQMKLKVQGTEDTRFLQMCNECGVEPSVYFCQDCPTYMCKRCNDQHRESDAIKYHIVQHKQDMYSLHHSFKHELNCIADVKFLHDELLVIADDDKLVTYNVTGQQQHTILLPGSPWCIAVVDKITVAVTLEPNAIVIVDVRQEIVTKHTDVKKRCTGIMCRDKQLFVGCQDKTIKIMTLAGVETGTIPVGVIPMYICGDEVGHIYYADYVKLYCIDTMGNPVFTFEYSNMRQPCGITTDDEGHVLFICKESCNVFRISRDVQQSQIIITQIPSSHNNALAMCYNSLSKSVVICDDNMVYVYKAIN